MSETVGQRLRRLRKGRSQAEVAELTGVSATSVSRHERDAQELTLSHAKMYAKGYGVTLNYIASGRR